MIWSIYAKNDVESVTNSLHRNVLMCRPPPKGATGEKFLFDEKIHLPTLSPIQYLV
jgi:hypothetical protein